MNKKWIFVDFDDTICLHTKWRPLTSACLDENIQMATAELYSHAEMNYWLYDYLLEQQNNEAHIILLTQASNIMLELKKCWLNTHCPKLKFEQYICVANGESSKAEIMDMFKEHYHLENKQLILIDDKSAERWDAEKKGFVSLNPQLIANKFHPKYNKVN